MDKRLQEAIKMYHLGNYKEAIQVLKDYVVQGSDIDGMGHYYLGLSCYDSGRLVEAENYLREAVNINSESSNYNYRLGLACARLMKFSEAVKYLTKSIELSSDNIRSKYILGTIYFKMGKLADAKKLFSGIIENNSENAASAYYLGLCEYHLGNLDEAEKYFIKTIDINSDFADAYIKLGNLYFSKHNYEKASEYYEKAYGYGVVDITLLLNYAMSLIGIMRYDKAEEILNIAKGNYPNNQEIEKLLEVFKDIKNL